jgi:PPOX class probable F420-dependent enzyme
MMDASTLRAALDGKKYLNLETYRKSGKGVRTPVWFALTPADAPAGNTPKLYVYTTADSGKAKRIRQSSVVKIAPCDVRGTVSGQWINAHAKVASGEEFVRGMRLINRKYCPWKQILDLSVLLFRRRERHAQARPGPRAGAARCVSLFSRRMHARPHSCRAGGPGCGRRPRGD